MFSGGIEKDRWHEIGSPLLLKNSEIFQNYNSSSFPEYLLLAKL